MVLIFNNIKENTEKKLFDVVCSLKKKKTFSDFQKKKSPKKKIENNLSFAPCFCFGCLLRAHTTYSINKAEKS